VRVRVRGTHDPAVERVTLRVRVRVRVRRTIRRWRGSQRGRRCPWRRASPGEIWARCGEIWGDMARCRGDTGEIWGDAHRGEHRLARYRRDVGRYGEIWGDVGEMQGRYGEMPIEASIAWARLVAGWVNTEGEG